MPDLSTTYMGLRLKNPLIAGSSGLTGTLEGLQDLQDGGVGAVVLKSIFEEEIAAEYDDVLTEAKRKGMSLRVVRLLRLRDPRRSRRRIRRARPAGEECSPFPSSPASTAPTPTNGSSFAKDIEAPARTAWS